MISTDLDESAKNISKEIENPDDSRVLKKKKKKKKIQFLFAISKDCLNRFRCEKSSTAKFHWNWKISHPEELSLPESPGACCASLHSWWGGGIFKWRL
ncbi:hypothetical protein CEXT_167391 [Caerostris extrusa]|uniref:Uncharacterized protein n=1 Tax=Caerostris extrusa TaxID=172846 RepID=A0AAV4W788_CAEEX|nr:hypothetical protein CEXT_167391 [Caerostris extrusa]